MACIFSLGSGCKMSTDEVKNHVKTTVKEDEDLKKDMESKVKYTVQSDPEIQKYMEDMGSDENNFRKKLNQKKLSFEDYRESVSKSKEIVKARDKEKHETVLSEEEYREKVKDFKLAEPYCEIIDKGAYVCNPPPDTNLLKLPYKALSLDDNGTTFKKIGSFDNETETTRNLPISLNYINDTIKFEKIPNSEFCVRLDIDEYICFETKDDMKSTMIKTKIYEKLKPTAMVTESGDELYKHKERVCASDLSLASMKCKNGYESMSDNEFCSLMVNESHKDIFSDNDSTMMTTLCQSVLPSCVPDGGKVAQHKSELCCSKFEKLGVCTSPHAAI
jgi:hypothetical protein